MEAAQPPGTAGSERRPPAGIARERETRARGTASQTEDSGATRPDGVPMALNDSTSNSLKLRGLFARG